MSACALVSRQPVKQDSLADSTCYSHCQLLFIDLDGNPRYVLLAERPVCFWHPLRPAWKIKLISSCRTKNGHPNCTSFLFESF